MRLNAGNLHFATNPFWQDSSASAFSSRALCCRRGYSSSVKPKPSDLMRHRWNPRYQGDVMVQLSIGHLGECWISDLGCHQGIPQRFPADVSPVLLPTLNTRCTPSLNPPSRTVSNARTPGVSAAGSIVGRMCIPANKPWRRKSIAEKAERLN